MNELEISLLKKKKDIKKAKIFKAICMTIGIVIGAIPVLVIMYVLAQGFSMGSEEAKWTIFGIEIFIALFLASINQDEANDGYDPCGPPD